MVVRILAVLAAATVAVSAQSLANSFFAETGTNAGFYSRINQKGFDLLSDYLHERVVKFMSSGEMSFNLTSNVNPQVQFSLVSSRVGHFDEKSFVTTMAPVPNKGIVWSGNSLNASIITQFLVISPSGEVRGEVPLSFDKTNIELLLWTGVNTDGHLKTDLVTCKVAANDVNLSFSPTDAAQLGAVLPLITHFIREHIEQAICPTFHAELVPVVSNRLLNTPLSAALFDQYFLNYGMLGPVQFQDDAAILKHRGNAFGILRQGRTRLNDFRLPFRAPALSSETESDRMLDFVLSNYTMGSLFFWMDQYRKFDYEISRTATNNTAIHGYLKTDCGSDDICAGTLFPALGSRFPNGEVVIKAHTVSYPRLAIDPGSAVLNMDYRVDAFVQQGDRSRRFLTASMNVGVKMEKAHFRDYTLNADLHIDKFKIGEVASLVDGIDANSLEFLVNALNELILNEDMQKKLRGGVHLPIIFDFEQTDSEVVFEKDRIRISADYCYGSRCAAAVAESKDNEVDYYDVVAG